MIISKKTKINLCYGLTNKEFRCKCTNKFCRATVVNEKLLDAYLAFRLFVDVPLKINSGFRCAKHNYNTKGKSLSQHQVGKAIDIDSSSLLEFFSTATVIDIAMRAGFTFVKWYPKKKFFHMDVR